MSRYRLEPTLAQETILARHCAHARYVWNLAIEQYSWWWPGRDHAPGYCVQAAQLTEARAAFGWLADGSQVVQQQALRDFTQAMASYFAGAHGKPTWRKAGHNEGFRNVAVKPAHIRRLSRNVGQVWIPKAGWVRFRWSRTVPAARSYRVTFDRAGRWHIAFAAIPHPHLGPGDRPGRRHRPRSGGLGGVIHRRTAALSRSAPYRTGTASAAAAQAGPCQEGLPRTRTGQGRDRAAQGPRSRPAQGLG